ncbi:hypothetical protein FGO68_gene546 [Halteria grandinella]|uniref:Sigma-54 factor interaction domain-containing protein n=1 Tax=Halteria grandinella TaxID=5974 RepID=A0A8J8SUK9_HALGN|nr:hypothetical protein FGO68_gene546 [Halteria grandinella]
MERKAQNTVNKPVTVQNNLPNSQNNAANTPRAANNSKKSDETINIPTSNRYLKQAVNLGDFREDLYFRLNVMRIHIPPLCERPLDIMLLAQHFIQKYAHLNHQDNKPLSQSAEDQMMRYPWTGNVCHALHSRGRFPCC